MSQATVATTAALFRRHSRSWPFPYFLFLPKSNLFFSTALHAKTFGVRAQALQPMAHPEPGRDSSDNDEKGGKSRGLLKNSRNELKREARRAVRWGMDLATFSPEQIKRILRAASLEREVLDAILLAKGFGPDVREGKRRQFNYIGRLLRNVQPELMDALVQASKDGDTTTFQALTSQETLPFDDIEDNKADLESDEEEGDKYMEIADKWFDGLVYKDSSITNEVYSVHTVDFDRQELRRLVRRVHSIQEGSHIDDSGLDNDAMLTKAKKTLLRFLRSLAKESLVEA